jgi:predicted ATPase/class 3 adenylate cyclase
VCDSLGVAERPTGTVTFLFTDVEGSTRLWEEHPAEMQVALEHHDEILRSAIEGHGGYVFSTAGDAFSAAFGRVGDAVDAAVAAQRRLAAERWSEATTIRVRMGIHTGEAQERGGDYFGGAVNRAARIMAAGHGGRVLCSSQTAGLVLAVASSGLEFEDLGEVRLKDLLEPIRVSEALWSGRGATRLPLRSLDGVANNLPVLPTRLVGRSSELGRITELLATNRLVTLTGVGGCGKTRLALAAAAECVDRFVGGVVFVDLGPIASDKNMAEAIAAAAGIALAASDGAARRSELVRLLVGRDRLLVLDNCEHLLDAVAEFVEELLGAEDSSLVLATSREAIEVDGEQTYRIPPLGQDDSVGDGAAVELLIDRASSADADFVLTGEDRGTAVELCRRLDGLPLAIELAAAQLAHMSIGDVLDRLDERFELLVGGRRRRRQRQQTLQAVMDWSWELLEVDEQSTLAAMSVFVGSCTLDAIETVCSERPGNTSARVRSLVAKSLVEPRRIGDGVRYRLLETVRLFAQQKLVDSGSAEAVRRRHRDHYVSWVGRVPFDNQSLSAFWSNSFGAEFENIAAAIEWSLDHEEWDEAALLVIAGSCTWRDSHGAHQAVLWTERLIGEDLSSNLRARLLITGADAAMSAGAHRLMAQWSVESLPAAQADGDPSNLALAMIWSAIPQLVIDPEAARLTLGAAADIDSTPYIHAWASVWNAVAIQWDRLGEPFDVGSIDQGPADSVARQVLAQFLAINDALGGRLDAAHRHIEELQNLEGLQQRINNALGLGLLIDAISGDPSTIVERAGAARHELHQGSETLWRSELVLIVAIAHLRRGQPSKALGYLEQLKRAAMFAPHWYELRRRYDEQACHELADKSAIETARLNGRTLNVAEILDHELSPFAPAAQPNLPASGTR